MKVKELLDEWKIFLNKEMIYEVSLKKFQEQYPEFDTSSFSSQLKGNTDYLDIISNSIAAGQNHSADDFMQQFEFYKNSIEPNRNSREFLTVNIPGEDDPISLLGKLNQGSCTATYEDIQQFQQARMFVLGKGSKDKLNNIYEKTLNEASDTDFELVTENSDWIIYYPKTIKGSIALARSYWDGSKTKYDTTFNPSRGFGQNVGNIRWCTSVTGSGNMFLNYHRRLNLHMYYCINKSTRSIEDPLRKLCVSFSKKSKPELKIEFYAGSGSVNADNVDITEQDSKNYLGSLFDNLLKDVSQEKRLEIDIKSYYKSISLDQYIIMRRANEENIADFQNEISMILQCSKESSKILDNVVKDPSNIVRSTALNDDGLPPEILLYLARDEDIDILRRVARHLNTPSEALSILARDEDVKVRINVLLNPQTPTEIKEKIKHEINADTSFNKFNLLDLDYLNWDDLLKVSTPEAYLKDFESFDINSKSRKVANGCYSFLTFIITRIEKAKITEDIAINIINVVKEEKQRDVDVNNNMLPIQASELLRKISDVNNSPEILDAICKLHNIAYMLIPYVEKRYISSETLIYLSQELKAKRIKGRGTKDLSKLIKKKLKAKGIKLEKIIRDYVKMILS